MKMGKKKRDKLGVEVITRLMEAGYSDEEIGVYFFSSLSESLWEKMTSEQKAEYNNDYERFRENMLKKIPR